MGKTYKADDPNRPRKAGKHSRGKGRNQGHVRRSREEQETAIPRGGWRDRQSGIDWSREEIAECRGVTGTHPRTLDEGQRRKALKIVRNILLAQAAKEAAKARAIREDEEVLIRGYSLQSTIGEERANMVLRLTGRHVGSMTEEELKSALAKADKALAGVRPLLRPDLVVYGTDKRLYDV